MCNLTNIHKHGCLWGPWRQRSFKSLKIVAIEAKRSKKKGMQWAVREQPWRWKKILKGDEQVLYWSKWEHEVERGGGAGVLNNENNGRIC